MLEICIYIYILETREIYLNSRKSVCQLKKKEFLYFFFLILLNYNFNNYLFFKNNYYLIRFRVFLKWEIYTFYSMARSIIKS